MPRHKSYNKDIRKSRKARLVNRSNITRFKTALKKVLKAKTKAEAQDALKPMQALAHHLARKGYIKKNYAANKISSMTLFVSKMK